jgi:hypothetical protein
MALKIIQWFPLAILAILVAAIEFLDWYGRLEIIKRKWPRGWRAMNNRPMRLVLLIACFGLLVRDFRDIVATAPPGVNPKTETPS